MSDRCDGRCVTPEDLGVMGTGVEVAYPDLECSLHGKVHDSMRYGSLFTGGRGLDMAVEMLWPDAECAWVAENDRHASALLERRCPDVPNLGDLRQVDWTAVEPVDVMVGGYPCQPWSQAGRRKGFNDERDGWPWFRDAISVVRPQVVLLENVSGHLAGGAVRTVGDLAGLGYDAVWSTLRASDVGAPHRRERWFCAAYPAFDGRAEGRTGSGQRTGGAGLAVSDRVVVAVSDGAGTRRDPRGLPPTAAGSQARRDTDVRAAVDAGAAPPDTDGVGRERAFAQPRGYDIRGDSDAPADPDGDGLAEFGRVGAVGRDADRRDGQGQATDWGDHTAAIRRWESIFGRPAPSPTDSGGRLNPPFVEWMMGWPDGWTEPLPRSQRLKVLGNGVVPQQAAVAYESLLDRTYCGAGAA